MPLTLNERMLTSSSQFMDWNCSKNLAVTIRSSSTIPVGNNSEYRNFGMLFLNKLERRLSSFIDSKV